MASFFDEIAKNSMKSWLFMLLFMALFSGIIYFFLVLLGNGAPVSTSSFLFGFAVVLLWAGIVYFAGSKVILTVSRAQEADEKQYPTFYDAAQGLSSAMQVKMPKLYVIDDPNPNAFATGRRSTPAIAATTGLLKMMNRDELDGVIAHEMSHVADNDVQMMTITVAFAGAIGLMAAFIRNMAFWGMRGRSRNGGAIILVAFVIGLLAPLFALLIRLAISRRRESLADANGARITRDPASLVSALKKIQAYSVSPNAQNVMHANEITASMYFANPFKASSILNIFSTHPPIEQRIKALQAMY